MQHNGSAKIYGPKTKIMKTRMQGTVNENSASIRSIVSVFGGVIVAFPFYGRISVFRQGDIGCYWYAVLSGTLDVNVSETGKAEVRSVTVSLAYCQFHVSIF